MQKQIKLRAILIGEKAKEPLHYVESAEAVKGRGLRGDRYFYGKGTFNKTQLAQHVREISILPYETLEECNSRIESSLDFPDLRRNLVIKHFDAKLLEEKEFQIGSATFCLVRTCPPCGYLSRLLGEDMMTGLKYIGGYRASIIQSGMLHVGDEITLL